MNSIEDIISMIDGSLKNGWKFNCEGQGDKMDFEMYEKTNGKDIYQLRLDRLIPRRDEFDFKEDDRTIGWSLQYAAFLDNKWTKPRPTSFYGADTIIDSPYFKLLDVAGQIMLNLDKELG